MATDQCSTAPFGYFTSVFVSIDGRDIAEQPKPFSLLQKCAQCCGNVFSDITSKTFPLPLRLLTFQTPLKP